MEYPAVIKYEQFEHVYLFGGTPLIVRLGERLSDAGYKVTIYTAPRQAAEMSLEDRAMVFPVHDINASLGSVGYALGIGIGEAWQFGPRLREMFGTRLVDFMSIPYPRYLGGAHITHAILRGEITWGCCMQLVTENTNPGVVHDGGVIWGDTFEFPKGKARDVCAFLDRVYLNFIFDFVRKAAGGHTFYPTSEFMETFYPRLNSHRQAWVDWTWGHTDIVRFIEAFDDPFPGARTTIEGHIVTLHNAYTCERTDGHPFQSGLVVDADGNLIRVATRSGSFAVHVREDDKPARWIKPGMRLFTSRATLEHALTYTPNYTPIGDTNA